MENGKPTSDIDWRQRAADLQPDGRAFIAGKRSDAASGQKADVLNPANGQVVAQMAVCGSADIDRAVSVAREAFFTWSRTSAVSRKQILLRFAALAEQHQDELALLESVDTGKLIRQTVEDDVPSALETLRWYAEAADKVMGEVPVVPPGATAVVSREPLGVVAAIVPWNFPLDLAVWKLAPALASGNTLVLKPSEESCLSILRLAELAYEAGVPEGVFNVVTGFGADAGAALSNHMDIDALAFTGSTKVSRTLLEASARSNLKRLSLEAGGKSSNIVFADTTDLQAAAEMAAYGSFYNQGQVCSANSRILVERSILEEFEGLLKKAAAAYAPVDPLSGTRGNGSLITRKHTDNVEKWITRGRQDGEIAFGGERLEISGSDAYLEPTLLKNLPREHPAHHEEIFGPVATLQVFDSEDEAVALANDTVYGLAASVWTADLSRAHRVARDLIAGTISVNTVNAVHNTTPFGGFKQSGFGRDLSLQAFDNYTAAKTTWFQFD
ncbi:aldehyde dehydrogenase family protein [Arthrobacter russicus]|uniref:Aldehyde dehydrogenase (NAD+)/gamma-glutamyl-gamma-aminobutyraldehyde dehydrogenase n=2 Tax=Arthrobacter russicus TaxID=172040 RepID=A0ABU1J8P2_9MICC|nr:aldehyde dehydrogenase family protein [Arthrobacter russicus]MDR6268793.1 aldehyde dehydrogenase (NAD+)/gamma-glutamyl-gamma-aminobutyraldehyde dehydrogenase [Arthrobacter russicus]